MTIKTGMTLSQMSAIFAGAPMDDEAFFAAVDEAYKEAKEDLECAPTLRSAELPEVAPVSRNSKD